MKFLSTMNLYMAESKKNGIEFTHSFNAASWLEAEKIADEHDWMLLWEFREEPFLSFEAPQIH